MKRGDWVILVSVLGVGVAIGAGQAGLRTEIQSLRDEHRADMRRIEATVEELGQEIRALAERVARVEQALSPEPAKILRD